MSGYDNEVIWRITLTLGLKILYFIGRTYGDANTRANYMRQLKCLVVFLIGTIFIACENREPSSPINEGDTAKIIKLTLQTAFKENMPSINDTRINFLFGDSVIITADTTLINFLPRSIDSIKFKILDEK